LIVDAQIHLWTKKYLSPNAIKYIENLSKSMHSKPILEATAENYITEIEQTEIKKAIIHATDFNYGSEISQLEYNNYVSNIIKDYPDLFIGLCGVDPRRKNAIEIFEKGINKGFSGLKIFPGAGFRPDEDVCIPLYKIAEKNKLPVAIHNGFTASPFSMELSQPIFLEKIMEECPDLRLIACTQLAFPFTYELSAVMRKFENIYTDYAPMNIDAPEVGIAQNILSIKIMVDERHRIMFATNWPFSLGRVKEWTELNAKIKLPTLSRLVGLTNVSKKDREYIMGLTACDLFKIKK